jgi:hypothetical protein
MRTDVTRDVTAGCGAGDDFTDAAFGRALVRGMAVGAPLAFLAVFGIALVALGAHAVATAAAIAVWPAVLGGAFYGGLALMVPVAEACRPTAPTQVAPAPQQRQAA